MLDLRHLDAETRRHMLSELERDIADGRLFISPRLRPGAEAEYTVCLKTALARGDDSSLAVDIRSARLLMEREQRRLPSGRGVTFARVPSNAAALLAEGEFNRYYIRAVCCRALDIGCNCVVAYRAKQVRVPRSESHARIGKRLNAADLLADLRAHMGDDPPALGVPGGPNSGISVHLP